MEEKDKAMLILRGQSIIMEMLVTMMPHSLAEAWMDEMNQFNQDVVDAFGKPVRQEKKVVKD